MVKRIIQTVYALLILSVAVISGGTPARAQQELIPLTVELLNRSVNKLPFVIAEDRGLYRKHGLDVKLWMPDQTASWGTGEPAYEEFISVDIERPEDPDISVDGGTPMIMAILTNAQAHKRILVATTDCVVRWHIFAKDGINSLEDLKGQRLGISGTGAMTGFIARLLAQRMGWDHVYDISIMSNGTSVEALQKGWVDAYVAYEVPYAYALKAGLKPMVDMRPWDEQIAGSSVRVKKEWFQNPSNREATRRFLLATAEAISLFHKDNGKVAMEVMSKWHGIRDTEFARIILNGGKEMPRKPYPCVGGIEKTLELFDSNEARKYTPEDFYDDSLIREIDESGFIDRLYQ